jgi:hypothetical protein
MFFFFSSSPADFLHFSRGEKKPATGELRPPAARGAPAVFADIVFGHMKKSRKIRRWTGLNQGDAGKGASRMRDCGESHLP